MIMRIGVAVLLLLPTAAFAQGNPGPFGGLFGRTPERTGRDYSIFELRTSGGWQLDDAVLDADKPQEERVTSGSLAGASGHVMYDRESDRLRLRLRGAATYHEFLAAPVRVGGTTFENSAMFSSRVATRLSIDASATHLYTPFFYFEPIHTPYLSGVMAIASPYVARAVESHSGEGTVGFTSFYSKHASFSASVSRRETRFLQTPQHNFTMNSARGTWQRQLNRDLVLRLGYGRERVRLRQGDADELLNEVIDAGVDFTRGLSLTRRTTLGFQTQTAMVKQPPVGRHFRLNGAVNITHWFSRTWQLTGRVDRTTDFVPGFAEPLLADSAALMLAGLLSRKVEVVVRADAGHGQFGFDPSTGRFAMATATTQVGYALTRRFGFYGQHAFHFYEFPASASPVAPVAHLGRQTISIGVTAWIPVFIREREPSDTR